MATISIPKKEYQQLVHKALRYDYINNLLKEDIFSSPPTKNIREIVKAFGKTKLYSNAFLKSLDRGLRRSSCFKL